VPYQLHCALLLLQACEELDGTTLLDERLDEGKRLDEDELLEGTTEDEVDLLVVVEEVL
jgi:hypothetical protein